MVSIRSLAVLVLAAALEPGLGATMALDPPPVARGQLVEGVSSLADPSQTYTLYLPTHGSGTRTPALIVLDPRGRSVLAARLFVEAAETYGWILISSNDTRSDGPREPSVRALRALWPEATTRYGGDPARLYLAGFSGLGTLAWELARDAGDVAGVIVSASPIGEAPDRPRRPLRVPCFGTVGDSDFNYAAMRALHAEMRKQGTPERLEVFEGPHSWMPTELAREAIEWLELQAMKRGLRPVDEALVRRLLSEDQRRAAALEEAGHPLQALRHLQSAASTFVDLVPVDLVRNEEARLEAAPSTRRAREEEERWDAYEQVMRQRQRDALGKLARTDPPPVGSLLRSELRVDEIRKHADADGYEGVVGRRLIETLSTQVGFYVMQEFLRSGDLARASRCLEIAVELHPERAVYWYNLACVRARQGAGDEALDSLERAVALGFNNVDQIASDEDLESLHGSPRFRALLGRPAAPPTATAE